MKKKLREISFLWIVLGIILAELVLTFSYVIGFLIYAIFLGVVLILMETENEFEMDKNKKIIIFLMIISICRLAGLFLNFSLFWNTLIFYLLIIFLVLHYSIKFDIKSKPFIGNPSYFIGILLGAGALSLVGKYAFHLNFSGIIFLIPIIAYAEEIFFRGGFQNMTTENFGVFSILFTSLLYAGFSSSYGFLFATISLFASLVISTFYFFTKNLYFCFLLNVLFHVLVFIFYPIVFS
jgi:membrane protease YdiL (CAAX protease family)